MDWIEQELSWVLFEEDGQCMQQSITSVQKPVLLLSIATDGCLMSKKGVSAMISIGCVVSNKNTRLSCKQQLSSWHDILLYLVERMDHELKGQDPRQTGPTSKQRKNVLTTQRTRCFPRSNQIKSNQTQHNTAQTQHACQL